MTQDLPLSKLTAARTLLRLVDRESLEYMELVESIKQWGILKSMTVRRIGDKYQVIEGMHRYCAAMDLRLETVPCTVIEATDDEVLSIQVHAQAIGREPKVSDYARRLKRFMATRPELTMAGLSKIVGKSPGWIKRILEIMDLPDDVLKRVDRGQISIEAARLLSQLPPRMRVEAVEQAETMTAAEFRAVVAPSIRTRRAARRKRRQDEHYTDEFKPHAYMHTIGAILKEIEHGEEMPMLIARENSRNPLAIFRLALKWVLHLDPVSLEAARRKHAKLQRRGVPCNPLPHEPDTITQRDNHTHD